MKKLSMATQQEIFQRSELLLGDEAMSRIAEKRFKHEGQFPARKFQCVYSDELVEPIGAGKGSLVHITAIFGFMLAGLVIQDAVK